MPFLQKKTFVEKGFLLHYNNGETAWFGVQLWIMRNFPEGKLKAESIIFKNWEKRMQKEYFLCFQEFNFVVFI